MAERTIASVLKTVEALRSPGVRIPLSPLDPEGRRKAAFRPFSPLSSRFGLSSKCGPSSDFG